MGFVPQYSDYISQVKLPGSNTVYYVKDSEARDWIEAIASAGIKFTVAWDGESTPDVTKIPLGVTVTYSGQDYTGTLVASADTAPFIQLVYKKTTGTAPDTRKIYEEYITVTQGSGESGDPYTYFWEEIGDTDISIDDLGALAFKDSVTLNKNTDVVLGEGTTFTNSTSNVTFANGTTDAFVKSYPGSSKKLVKGSVLGVKSTTTTASKATAGTAVTYGNADVSSSTITCAKAASSATNVSRIALTSGNTSIVETASVTNECLTFGSASVTQSSVTGTNGTETFNTAVTASTKITPYTFSDVTVPIKDDNSSSFATGAVADDGGGDSILVGLGTATTANAVTSVGTATAAAQTITVGTNDKVTTLTSSTDVVVS